MQLLSYFSVSYVILFLAMGRHEEYNKQHSEASQRQFLGRKCTSKYET